MIEKDRVFFLLTGSNKELFEYMLSSAFERLKELNFHANNGLPRSQMVRGHLITTWTRK